MTPYEVIGLSFVVCYYCVKWWREKEKGYTEYTKPQHEHLRKKGIVIGSPDQFTAKHWAERRTGVHEIYPGKIWMVDHIDKTVHIEGKKIPIEEMHKLYDEEYWRKFRREHKHEEDPG